MLSSVKFIIVDLKKEAIEAFSAAFADLPNVTVVRSNILQCAADLIVSPANSKGLMDGGVDKPINYILGNIDERIVHPIIMSQWYGEQPVGTCFIVPTGHPTYKFLAHCPTMRLPCDVSETENAYTAMRALLREILHHNKTQREKITSVILTPFCTGAGNMPFRVAAKQMRYAYETTESPTPCTWKAAGDVNRILSAKVK